MKRRYEKPEAVPCRDAAALTCARCRDKVPGCPACILRGPRALVLILAVLKSIRLQPDGRRKMKPVTAAIFLLFTFYFLLCLGCAGHPDEPGCGWVYSVPEHEDSKDIWCDENGRAVILLQDGTLIETSAPCYNDLSGNPNIDYSTCWDTIEDAFGDIGVIQ